MNSTQVTDMLLVIQATITLFISLRAFSLFARTGDDTLFSLGLSMGVIALGGMIGLISDLALFWIAWGIVIYTLQFSLPDPLLLNYVGDSTRIVGLIALLAAFFLA